MNIETGREFSFVNPQDDPQCFGKPPPGYRFDLYGRLVRAPLTINETSENSARDAEVEKALLGAEVGAANFLGSLHGVIVRVVEVDGHSCIITHDYRRNRVNVRVTNGKITSIHNWY